MFWVYDNLLRDSVAEDVHDRIKRIPLSYDYRSSSVKEPKVSIKDEEVYEKVRTRTVKGRYKADNKETPEVNEAWTTKKVNIKRVNKKKK